MSLMGLVSAVHAAAIALAQWVLLPDSEFTVSSSGFRGVRYLINRV
jgi:hypothetical protein